MNKMKKILALYIITIFFACNGHRESKDTHDHDHDAVEQSGKAHDNAHEEENEELLLSESQLKTANVAVLPLQKKLIRNRLAVTGSIEAPPQNKATIYAPREAFVYKTDLLPGDRVRKGQVVAVLQHPSFIELQYAYLDAVNKRDVAKADYLRKKMLFEKDIASKKSFLAIRAQYKSLESLVSSYKTQLKMAGIDAVKVEASGIQQFISIRSPIAGFVVENNLNQGKYLAANSEMMEIIDNDHIHAELRVFGADAHRIKKGDDFVFVPSGIDTTYQGYIKLISQKVEQGNKTVNVHGHFEDPDGVLKSGMFINAEILMKGTLKYAVPVEAVIEKEGEQFVFVQLQSGVFKAVKVYLGDTDRGYVALDAIENDDWNQKVVVRGAHFLKGKLLQQLGGMEGHAH